MAGFAASDGRRIHFEDQGSGQPVLCLAGLTRCGRDFSWLAPHLPDIRLIRMDYRGRGRSEHDPDWRNYNLRREGLDALDLLDHLGLERAVILGTSRGGLIAMMLAATAPDRVAGAILNDVGPVIAPGGLARIIDYLGRKPDWPTHDAAARGLKQAHEAQFPGVPLARWRAQAAFQFDQGADGLTLRYDPALRTSVLAQAEAAPPPDLWPWFDALAARPAGVIRGANSDVLSARTLAEMQDRNPALITAQVPDRGHVPFLDEPASLAVIRNILEETG